MIVACPACRRAFRLPDERARPGARLRCGRCGHQFAAGPPRDPAASAAAATPAPGAPPPAAAGAASPSVAVVADGGRGFAATHRAILQGLGYRVELAPDGAGAFRTVVALRPALLVASVHTGGLSGVALCEGIKGSPHLRGTRVALVGSSLSSDLFNRDTALAYGADLFLEEGLPPEETTEALRALASAAIRSADDDLDGPLDAITRDPGAPTMNARDEIQRLARIMLADLRLYNPERYDRAARDGSVFETFRDELHRGRDLVERRFPEVASRQDILARALREGLERERARSAAG